MEWFRSLGFNEKQQKVYMHLLEEGALSASQLAIDLGEQRTNVYLLLEPLISAGLVEKDEARAVARFVVVNPERLQEIMISQQKKLATHASQMKKDLPNVLGLYHLNTASDGVAYFEGIKGYEAALEEMNRSASEVCVFGAAGLELARPDAWDILLRKLQQRAHKKVETRILFDESVRDSTTLSSSKTPALARHMEARFWGSAVFEGEVTVYGHTVVLTSYDEKLVSLVIKNKTIATTLQVIFDTAWQQVA